MTARPHFLVPMFLSGNRRNPGGDGRTFRQEDGDKNMTGSPDRSG